MPPPRPIGRGFLLLRPDWSERAGRSAISDASSADRAKQIPSARSSLGKNLSSRFNCDISLSLPLHPFWPSPVLSGFGVCSVYSRCPLALLPEQLVGQLRRFSPKVSAFRMAAVAQYSSFPVNQESEKTHNFSSQLKLQPNTSCNITAGLKI